MKRVAQAALKLPENVPGDFFVDSSCIDCDACRIFAPSVFSDHGDESAGYHQPATPDDLLAGPAAPIPSPTASIGSTKHDMRAAVASLPELVAGDVYRCGYTSESSFGAISYYAGDAKALVDSPRFAMPVVKNIEKLGGVRTLLLTHQDDVADHAKFHEHFGCDRVLHRDDVRARTAGVERQPTGLDPVQLADDLLMPPPPGNPKGLGFFLSRDPFLFPGAPLAWNGRRGHLYAFRGACWYSWTEQIASMKRLLDYDFEWVLPGHGRPVHLP